MNKNFRFGKKSLKQLSTLDAKLQHVCLKALELSPVDFGLIEGYRSIERQQELFKQRTADGGYITKVDGIKKKSKHNYSPSLAVDICPYFGGKYNYDNNVLLMLGGIFIASANELEIEIRWGGDWNRNGVPVTDQSFQDLPHFELIQKK